MSLSTSTKVLHPMPDCYKLININVDSAMCSTFRSDNCLLIKASQYAELLEGGFIGPFNFVKVCTYLM